MVCYAVAPGCIIKWQLIHGRPVFAHHHITPFSSEMACGLSPTLRCDEPNGNAHWYHGVWRICDLWAQEAQVSCRSWNKPPLWQREYLSCLLPSHSSQAGEASTASAPLPGVAGWYKDCHHFMPLPHRQGREVWGEWMSWCDARGCDALPDRGSSGTQSLLQAVQRSQSTPGGCVQHGRGTFPNSRSLNGNFQPRNGLRWGW